MKTNFCLIALLAGLLISFLGCSSEDDTPEVAAFADADKTACNYSTDGEDEVRSGDISENTTWDAKCIRMEGYVRVKPGVTLTVAAGSTVLASNAELTVLVVEQGGKLMAEGTASEPIVFTSGKAVGDRKRGDWGGITINGKSQYNKGGQADGSNTGTGEGETGSFGGNTVSNDNSGSLRYVRIEFGGRQFGAENELNGLSLQAVGSGTTLDFVHLHRNSDDGVEMFGGTVNVNNLISTANGDDQLDWTNGWQGTITKAVLMPFEGDHAIEADNDKASPQATPVSKGTLNELYVFGDGDDRGLLFRVGTSFVVSDLRIGRFETCIQQDKIAEAESSYRGPVSSEGCGTFYTDADPDQGKDPVENPTSNLLPDGTSVTTLTEDNIKDKLGSLAWTRWTEFPQN